MLRSHSPLPAQLPPPPQALAAPFTLLRTPLRTPGKPIEDPSLEEKVNHLTEALYQMDLEGKPVKKPFKPFCDTTQKKIQRKS